MIALEYILLLVAFSGALVGSLGPKRIEGRAGFQALTIWGWSGLLLALFSLLAAGVMAFLRLDQQRQQARESARVGAIAALQLQREMWHLIGPLEAILAGNTGEGQFYPCQDHFDLGLHRFRGASYRRLIGGVKLASTLPDNLGRPEVNWATYIDDVHSATLTELSRLVATYSGHVDSETIWRVEKLAEDLRGLRAKAFVNARPESTVRQLYYFVGGLENSDQQFPGWLAQLDDLSAKLRSDYDYSEYGSSLAWHIVGRRCLNGASALDEPTPNQGAASGG